MGNRSTAVPHPLRQRPFRWYFLARTVSATGSAVAPIALAFAVLDIGGTATALGGVLAAGLAPQILLLLLGGALADRLPRARLMLACNLVCAAAQTVAAALLVTGTARVAHLLVLAAVTGGASAFHQPAATGIVPQLVDAPHRQQANALTRLVLNVVKVAAPVTGGLVVATVGPGWAIGWDAVSFLLAAGLLTLVRVPLGTVRVGRGDLRAEIREGWVELRGRPWLLGYAVHGAVIIVPWLSGYQLLGPVYADSALGGAAAWGVVTGAFGTGLLGGSALALAWRPTRPGVVMCVGTGSMALPLLAMAAGGSTPVVAGAALLTGIGLDVAIVSSQTLMQGYIPADRLGRVTAFTSLAELLPVPIGYLASGPVAAALGLGGALGSYAGIIVVATAVLVAWAPIRRLRYAAAPQPDQPAPPAYSGACIPTSTTPTPAGGAQATRSSR